MFWSKLQGVGAIRLTSAMPSSAADLDEYPSPESAMIRLLPLCRRQRYSPLLSLISSNSRRGPPLDSGSTSSGRHLSPAHVPSSDWRI